MRKRRAKYFSRGVLPHSTSCLIRNDQLAARRLILPSASVVSFLSVAFSVVSPKLLRPGDQAAITYNFVMLGGLRSVDQRHIQHVLVRDLVGFLDN
jgi:hypothetical protein